MDHRVHGSFSQCIKQIQALSDKYHVTYEVTPDDNLMLVHFVFPTIGASEAFEAVLLASTSTAHVYEGSLERR